MSCWTERHSKYNHDRREWSRPGYIGGRELFGGGGKIEFSHHFSGSGRGAFGEKEHWPNVTLNLGFPEGDDEIAIKFCDELQLFVDNFLEENGLGIPDDCRDSDYD